MHRMDKAAFGAMVTAELAKQAEQKSVIKTPSALQKFLIRILNRQLKSGQLDKAEYRYIIRMLMPKVPGFHTRWDRYLSRYQQISAMERNLEGKSDWSRVMQLFAQLSAENIVTAVDIQDSHRLEGEEQVKVAKYGFVGICESQNAYIDSDGYFTDLVVLSTYAPTEDFRMKILSAFQLYGFDIYEPETRVNPKQVGSIALIGSNQQQTKAA